MRCCAAHALGTMQVECAKHAQIDHEEPAGIFFVSVNPEHMAGSATASLYMISSIESLAYGEKYSLSGNPDSQLLTLRAVRRAQYKSILIAILLGGTDAYAMYLGHR